MSERTTVVHITSDEAKYLSCPGIEPGSEMEGLEWLRRNQGTALTIIPKPARNVFGCMEWPVVIDEAAQKVREHYIWKPTVCEHVADVD